MPETTLAARTQDGTRGQILELLLARGRMTIAGLAETLGLAPGGLRRHLQRLRAEGLVEVELHRRDMGRPSYVYLPTEAAEVRNAQYARFTERLVEEVTVLRPDEVLGLDGRELLTTVFHGIARRIAGEHRPRVSEGAIDVRIEEVTGVLHEEGILSGWERSDEGYRLFNATCPYRKVAHNTAGACSMDREVIEELLGLPVEQVARLVDGELRCEYLVRAQPGEDDSLTRDRSRQSRHNVEITLVGAKPIDG